MFGDKFTPETANIARSISGVKAPEAGSYEWSKGASAKERSAYLTWKATEAAAGRDPNKNSDRKDDPALPNGVKAYIESIYRRGLGGQEITRAQADEEIAAAMPLLRGDHPNLDIARVNKMVDELWPVSRDDVGNFRPSRPPLGSLARSSGRAGSGTTTPSHSPTQARPSSPRQTVVVGGPVGGNYAGNPENTQRAIDEFRRRQAQRGNQ
jgi:hypothetical protein